MCTPKLATFINTLNQIVSAEQVDTFTGIYRHLNWQYRRAFKRFPTQLQLGKSRLIVEEPTGVAALVNCMGKYDFNNMSLLSLLPSNSVFLDVGANLGTYTLLASENPSVNVYSFEPHPRSFHYLRNNLEFNGRSNVTAVNCAISDRDGESRLSDGRELSTNRLLCDRSTEDEGIPVSTRSLDSLCHEFKISPVAVKVDVEGHEMAVLNGFEAASDAADLLIVENGERREIRSWMSRKGWSGPFYFHFRSMVFKTTPQRRPEDPIFLRKSPSSDAHHWLFDNCTFIP